MISSFVTTALAFPTVVLSLGLCIVILFWLKVLIGTTDMHLFDGHADGGEIGHGDVGHGDDVGHADGADDGGLDHGGDAADGHDGAGGHDGADGHDAADHDGGDSHDASDHDGADGDDAADHDNGGSKAARKSVATAGVLRVGEVPVTITLSFLILYAWALCFMGVEKFGLTGLPGVGLLIGALVVALPAARLSSRPFAGLFKSYGGLSHRDLRGSTCKVLTSRVDANFGQAEWSAGGTTLIIQVRCDRPNDLSKGSEVLLIQQDKTRQAYIIEPLLKELP